MKCRVTGLNICALLAALSKARCVCHCSFVLERVGPEGLSKRLFHSPDESSAARGMKVFMVFRARDVP